MMKNGLQHRRGDSSIEEFWKKRIIWKWYDRTRSEKTEKEFIRVGDRQLVRARYGERGRECVGEREIKRVGEREQVTELMVRDRERGREMASL